MLLKSFPAGAVMPRQFRRRVEQVPVGVGDRKGTATRAEAAPAPDKHVHPALLDN